MISEEVLYPFVKSMKKSCRSPPWIKRSTRYVNIHICSPPSSGIHFSILLQNVGFSQKADWMVLISMHVNV